MKKIYVSKKESNNTICNSILLLFSQFVSNKSSSSSSTTSVSIIVSFISGCIITTTILINQKWYYQLPIVDSSAYHIHRDMWIQQSTINTIASSLSSSSCPTNNNDNTSTSSSSIIQQKNLIEDERYLQQQQQENDNTKQTDTESDIDKYINTNMILKSLRILVVIVSYDFSQLPHLEEVLSSYHDVCSSSGLLAIDIHIHTTVPYPVSLIDLLNSRINCNSMTITIIVKPKSLRLYLVNCHRQTFYNNINNYDLFIYTEDDIRVTATTISSYLYETKFVEQTLLKLNTHLSINSISTNRIKQYKSSDFNIGIVRYEYNYPSNVIIDDKTRHATQNVTRVYWESSGKYDHNTDVIPYAVQTLNYKFPSYTTSAMENDNNTSTSNSITTDIFNGRYITMNNHHQGMFLVTRQLLIEWDKRCNFSIPTKRPGTKHIPSDGTQRVWMSTNMLYRKHSCNVQQLLPTNTFGTLTVLHLPNKNYRRVGKYNNRTFATGTEVFDQPHTSLLSSMELHIAVRQYMYTKLVANKQQQSQSQQQRWFSSSTINQNSDTTTNKNVNIYTGAVRMIDDVDIEKDRTPFLERRMKEYENYIQRGGILSETDMKDFDLSDTSKI